MSNLVFVTIHILAIQIMGQNTKFNELENHKIGWAGRDF